jgi:hypothetical protein
MLGPMGLLALCAAVGCERNERPAPTTGSPALTNAPADNPQPQTATKRTPQELAVQAKEAMFNELSTQLVSAMSNGGPALAIEACGKLAPKVAKEIGLKYDVSIGRTSARLRNSNNRTPEWAIPLPAEIPEKPIFKELVGGRTGALFPITLKVQCLTCHGPEENISADIRSELARLYPNDKATGFHEGDLRGWFWVEVPADE